jgi:hypothetical protein
MPENRYRLLGAGLAVLVGVAVAGAGLALLKNGAETSSEIVASDVVARGVGAAALTIGLGLIAGGLAAAFGIRAASLLAGVCALAFDVVGFVANYLLFASPRLAHTGTNAAVAGVILWLLWMGKPRQTLRARGD